MTTKKLTKLLALYLPYILLGLAATNLGEAWRIAEGIYGKRLDLLLAQMRKNKVAVNLKAILTEHNVGWSGLQLYEELKKEHEQMHS